MSELHSCVNNRYEPALIDQLLCDLDSLGGLEAFVRLVDEERS